MRIGLFVDSYWRDAPGNVLLKIHLEKLGAIVDLVSFDLWQQYLQLIKPNHIVLNHAIGNRNKAIIKEIRKHGGTISVVPTEGRPNTKTQVDWFAQQSGIDYVFHWSSQTKNALKHIPGDIYGCPRFELYHHEPLIDSRISTLQRHSLLDKPTILFATSFPQAKFNFQSISFNRNDWNDLEVPFDADETAQNESVARNESLSLLRLIASGNKFQIILRPHPMEDTIWWERNLPDNVSIITQDFIHNLINASDIVVNRAGCTTTLESWILNKPVVSVSYTPGDLDSGAAKEIWNTQKCKSDNIASAYSCITNGSYDIDINKRHLKKYGLLKHNVCQRIAEKIIEIAGSGTQVPLTNKREWMRIVLEHNDKYVYPHPGFHPGKIPTKYKMDNLINTIEEIYEI